MRLMDGLGNQLFQYALGRRLAIDRSAPLFLDAQVFDNGSVVKQPRRLSLHSFEIRGDITNDDRWTQAWVRPGPLGGLSWRIEQTFVPLHRRRFVQEHPEDYKKLRSTFRPDVLRVRPGTYLFGWWVSHRYFDAIASQLRAELTLSQALQATIAPLLQRIRSCEAVSIHVRRGDFAKHADFGLLDASYYERALRIVREKTQAPRFFVFSDDAPAAAQLVRAAGLHEFEMVQLPTGTDPACDLWLMANCKHFVNANSTFSWWGAWLSQHPGKSVIVPRHWYVGAHLEIDDVYPREWIRIED